MRLCSDARVAASGATPIFTASGAAYFVKNASINCRPRKAKARRLPLSKCLCRVSGKKRGLFL